MNLLEILCISFLSVVIIIMYIDYLCKTFKTSYYEQKLKNRGVKIESMQNLKWYNFFRWYNLFSKLKKARSNYN